MVVVATRRRSILWNLTLIYLSISTRQSSMASNTTNSSSSRFAVVTGGTRGIGLEVVRQLVEHNYKVRSLSLPPLIGAFSKRRPSIVKLTSF